ncbi:MAG: S49 family peptidase [Proteobacteria bacterium]|nr:S49 family peptidase [Pseudomonadota bacterium]
MPAWNDILERIHAAGSTYDIVRRSALQDLCQVNGDRNVIIYYSGWLQKPHYDYDSGIDLGISDSDKNGFMSAIFGLDRKKGLDLILHTPGGDMAATESLIDYVIPMFKKDVRAIVPQLAMSGGTIMALACTKIIMGKHSSIGPIDPQFDNMSATGWIKEFERIRDDILEDQANALLWEPILRQIEPGFVTECEDTLKWSKKMATRFLGQNMFWRVNGKKDIIEEIVGKLTDKSSIFSHGRHIGLKEAKKIFGKDNVIAMEDNGDLQEAILTVHHASIITLDATHAYKIIENQNGRAYIQKAQQIAIAK